MKFITVQGPLRSHGRGKQLTVDRDIDEGVMTRHSCDEVEIHGPSAVRHDPSDPHDLGAHTWIETRAPITMIPGGDVL